MAEEYFVELEEFFALKIKDVVQAIEKKCH
jgi:hypothetical protein